MSNISTNIVEEAIYNLCFEANTCLNKSVYSKVQNAYKTSQNKDTKDLLAKILENAKVAYENKLPLCQDTGQVIIFIEIGQNVNLSGKYIETAINRAVEKCYKENFFRKSVVKNAIFDRINTNTNTPINIYTKIITGDLINIKVLVKGAGSENKSKLEMFLPTISEKELIENIGNLILSTAENACPPMFIGIGAGLSADGALVLSKQALVSDNFKEEELNLAEKIKNYVNKYAPKKYKDCYVLDIKLLSAPTHIACLPIAITINCHSDRFSSCSIKDNKVIYNHEKPDFIQIEQTTHNYKEIFAHNIDDINLLKEGETAFLSGEIYVARDMAHKNLVELINNKQPLPFQIEKKIIFYAGPCPAKPNEITGSIGPTTSSRMDEYADILYKNGIIATIGKGSRSDKLKNTIKETGAKYFTVQGGIAALLSKCVVKSEIIAFPDLGAEALYKIQVNKLPIKLELM